MALAGEAHNKKSMVLSLTTLTLLLFLLLLLFQTGQGSKISGPIKTIVVLVMENRSFDHMLGWMKSIDPRIDGVTGKECNPKSTLRPYSDLLCFSPGARFVDLDPSHSFEAVKEQVFGAVNLTNNYGPLMNGFVQQALAVSPELADQVMKGFGPDSVPIYRDLIQEFAVFHRWFSSLPGPTQPNRLFAFSATSHGSTSHVLRQLLRGYPQKTIFDSVYESGLDFGVYYKNIPSTLLFRDMRRLKYVSKFHNYESNFERDARNGQLPNLCVIEPRYFGIEGYPADDDHPSHDVSDGQRLVKEVYELLRASPQWNETLLIITYDEHGGFFDHVPTPVNGIPSPDGNTGLPPFFFKFDRLGVRVPTIMASPWIKKGTVVGRPYGPTKTSEFEHSSIPATIKKLFNLDANFLTHRDAWAGTFEHIVSELRSPRTDCPEVLDELPTNSGTAEEAEIREDSPLSEFQSEVVNLASILNGDHYLSSFPDGITSKMNVKQASKYVNDAVSRFIEASIKALKLGANDSAIVDMRCSLTTRKGSP